MAMVTAGSFSVSILTAIFQLDLGKPISERLHSGFCWC